MHVLFADLAVKKPSFTCWSQVHGSSWSCCGKELSERGYWWCHARSGPVRKPGHPSEGVVGRGVQQRGALPRNHQLQPRNLVKIDSENRKPVIQPIHCDLADREHLLNGGSP